MGRTHFIVLFAVLVIALSFAACDKKVILTGTNIPNTISPDDSKDSNRPDIPRVNPPGDTPDNKIYENPGEKPHGPTTIISPPAVSPGVELDVPLGDTLGKHHPVLTRNEFPLLIHPPIRVSDVQLLGYEERLRFDFGVNTTGRLIFGQDPNNEDSIGTFLKYEDRKPIMEYTLTLDRGTFADIQGRDIQILGHVYTIAEATNNTVTLYGKTIASNLLFENGSKIYVNSSRRTNTLAFVKRNMIGYTLYTHGDDGDILLQPSKDLAMEIGQDMFASQLLNIRYVGSPSQNATLITMRKTDYGYKIVVDTFAGKRVIPIVEQAAGRLIIGKEDEPLRLTPCPPSMPYCIAPDTWLLLTRGDKTFYVQYLRTNDDVKTVVFKDSIGNRYSYQYLGNESRNQAYTELILSDTTFRVRIGKKDNITGTHNISIDQGFTSGRAELITLGEFVVRIEEPRNLTLPLRITVPPKRTNGAAEHTNINLTYDPTIAGWRITVGNMTFIEDENTKDSFGMTRYGLAVLLDRNKRDMPPYQGDEAKILMPRSRAYGLVKIEG